MRTLSAPVGPGQKNNWRDVALVQIWLARQSKVKLGDIKVDGLYSPRLGEALVAVQEAFSIRVSNPQDRGVLRPGGAAFAKLGALVPSRVRNIRLAWTNGRSIVAFDGNASSGFWPNVPSEKEIRLHHRATIFLQRWLKHALVGFRVVGRKITASGDLELELAPVSAHYDVEQHVFRVGLSDAYFKEFLNAFRDPNYQFLRSTAGNLRFVWKVGGDLFKPPLMLTAQDKKRLRHRDVPSRRSMATDSFHDAVLASLVKPWRQIQDVDKKRGRYLVPAAGVKGPNFVQRRVAAEILQHYGDYSKNIEATYKLIAARAGKKDATAPLIKAHVGVEATVLVGLSIEVGFIIDLNTNKEYLVLEAHASAGLEFGLGVTGGVDALYRPIEDLIRGQGASSSTSVSKDFEVGPIKFAFEFRGDKTKIPPDVKWDGLDFDFGDAFDFTKRNVSEVAADLETGERIPSGGKTAREKRERKRKKSGDGIEFSVATIDFGSVLLKLSAVPKLSTKLSTQFGPKYSFDYKRVFEIDYDEGWQVLLVRRVLKSILPERQFQRYELFPPN